MRPIIAVVLLLVSAAFAADDSIEAKLSWPVDKRFSCESDIRQEMTTSLPGQQPLIFKQGRKVSAVLTVVKRLPAGGWETVFEFAAIRMAVDAEPNAKIGFDSASDPAKDGENPVAKPLRTLIGSRIRVFMDPQGRIERVDGADEPIKKAGDEAGADLLRGVLGAESFSKMMNAEWVFALPKKPVKPGDTWTVKQVTPRDGLGEETVSLRAAFTKWEVIPELALRCARFEYMGTMSLKLPSADAPPVKTIEGTIEMAILFDPSLGVIARQEIKDRVRLADQTSDGKAAVSEMRQTTANRIVKIEDAK